LLDQSRYASDGELQHTRIVATSVQQRNAAIDEFTGRLQRRFRDCHLDNGPDATICGFLIGSAIPGVTNPKPVRLDLVHLNPPPNPGYRIASGCGSRWPNSGVQSACLLAV